MMFKLTCSNFIALLPLLLSAGCTTMGTGYGTTATGTNPVHFDWKSADDVSGTLQATLADGSIYAGTYFQITDNTSADTLEPLWDGWGAGWGGEGFFCWPGVGISADVARTSACSTVGSGSFCCRL